jgi:2-dehydro-3-deoxygalactonokinase
VNGRRITAFATYMTGELFGLLRGHSILGRMMTEAAPDGAAFRQGLQSVADDGTDDLLHALFGVRSRGLFGQLTAETAPDFLSGLLIGSEIRSATAWLGEGRNPMARKAVVIGEDSLSKRYDDALTAKGWQVARAPAGIVVRGLACIVRQAGPKEGRTS